MKKIIITFDNAVDQRLASIHIGALLIEKIESDPHRHVVVTPWPGEDGHYTMHVFTKVATVNPPPETAITAEELKRLREIEWKYNELCK